MKPDIRHWRDIDADYMNAVLALNGIDAKVAGLKKKPVGTGQIGDCIRFTLEYQTSAPDAPQTLIGKFPADAEDSRNAGIFMGTYIREVKFYQLLQPNARITTPDCYFADINEETHDFVLMMSDAAPAEQGDQLTGITVDETKAVLREAAKLHSAFWLDETLNEHAWISNTPKAPTIVEPDQFRQAWAGFQDRYGALVSARAKQVGSAICKNYEPLRDAQSERQCLVHGDFRPDNMLFATEQGGKPLTVVDWQSVTFGPAAADIGNCIAGALAPELRRQHETELLELYAEDLHRLGAKPYAMDELMRHYVLGAYQHFTTAFFASMFVTQTSRGDEMFFKMLNGAVEMIYDHSAEDWFA